MTKAITGGCRCGAPVELASAVDAVACATAVPEGMAARNRGVPGERRIAFRIGVHLGDVMVDLLKRMR